MARVDIYGGRDPRTIPTYGINESAHLLKIPPDTLTSWVRGRNYPTRQGTKRFYSLIMLAEDGLALLSFINLLEAHVLDAIRYKDKIPLKNVRNAIAHLSEKYQSEHPLIEFEFQHDGVDLFIELASKDIVNVSRQGQLALRDVVTAYLKRIARDAEGAAIALYPYLTRHPIQAEEEPKPVLINPRINFGKPILVGIGVPTSVVSDRFDAGETTAELAEDYGCQEEEIQEAIKYEHALPKAA